MDFIVITQCQSPSPLRKCQRLFATKDFPTCVYFSTLNHLGILVSVIFSSWPKPWHHILFSFPKKLKIIFFHLLNPHWNMSNRVQIYQCCFQHWIYKTKSTPWDNHLLHQTSILLSILVYSHIQLFPLLEWDLCVFLNGFQMHSLSFCNHMQNQGWFVSINWPTCSFHVYLQNCLNFESIFYSEAMKSCRKLWKGLILWWAQSSFLF
jgi:hypothetical protein